LAVERVREMGRAVRGRAGDSPLSKGAAQGVSKLRGGAI